MPSVADDLDAAIAAHGGALRFDRYLDIVLYGQSGFYTTQGQAGRRGDFLTSPEVGPLFGAVVARWLDHEWLRLDRPERFRVIDLGAGPGTLARTVLAAAPQCLHALDYVAVEVSASQRAQHPGAITSLAHLPTDRCDGVVLANEFVDNVPFRLVVFDGHWREAYITKHHDRILEILRPLVDAPAIPMPTQPRHGARLPLHQMARELLVQASDLVPRGRLGVIDYAVATTAHLAGRPWREWLRTYRGHERGKHYLVDPGEQDITTEVALDQLFGALGDPSVVRSQSQWLQRWGIDELVHDGRRFWTEHAARPNLEAMRMRSRISEAEALLDPSGLGSFLVAEWELG